MVSASTLLCCGLPLDGWSGQPRRAANNAKPRRNGDFEQKRKLLKRKQPVTDDDVLEQHEVTLDSFLQLCSVLEELRGHELAIKQKEGLEAGARQSESKRRCTKNGELKNNKSEKEVPATIDTIKEGSSEAFVINNQQNVREVEKSDDGSDGEKSQTTESNCSLSARDEDESSLTNASFDGPDHEAKKDEGDDIKDERSTENATVPACDSGKLHGKEASMKDKCIDAKEQQENLARKEAAAKRRKKALDEWRRSVEQWENEQRRNESFDGSDHEVGIKNERLSEKAAVPARDSGKSQRKEAGGKDKCDKKEQRENLARKEAAAKRRKKALDEWRVSVEQWEDEQRREEQEEEQRRAASEMARKTCIQKAGDGKERHTAGTQDTNFDNQEGVKQESAQQQGPDTRQREQNDPSARECEGSTESKRQKQQSTHPNCGPFPASSPQVPETPHAANTSSAGASAQQDNSSHIPQWGTFEQPHLSPSPHQWHSQSPLNQQQYHGHNMPADRGQSQQNFSAHQWQQCHPGQQKAQHWQHQDRHFHCQRKDPPVFSTPQGGMPQNAAWDAAHGPTNFSNSQGMPPPAYPANEPNPPNPPNESSSWSEQNGPSCQPTSPSFSQQKQENDNAIGEKCAGALKWDILVSWALLPPSFQILQQIDVLVTTVHTAFPPAFGVKGHKYFAKWTPITRESLGVSVGTSSADERKLTKAVRKVRFFLHPDRLPRDLNEEQAMVCKLLWDVTSDAWESHNAAKHELDWLSK